MPRQSKRRAAATVEVAEPTAPKRQKTTNARKQPEESKFNTKRLMDWFKKYTTDDPTQLGPEGMEQFCQDLKLEPENVVMLCIAFKMRAKNMGFFTLQEWQQGLADAEVLCDSVEKLQKKIGYFRQMLNDPAEFKKIFRFAFDFARDKDQRSMDIETAKAMLALLLGKTWPLFSEFDEFLHLPKAPRVINKDQWNNIYEFSTLIQTDLSNYCVDGAWPVLLDDFVEFLLQKKKIASS